MNASPTPSSALYRLVIGCTLPALLTVSAGSCVAQEAATATTESAGPATPSEVVDALRRGDRPGARDSAGRLLQTQPDDLEVIQLVADAMLRSGDVEQAATLYDRYAEGRPEELPYLWQRGIALTLGGRFADGEAQFEQHQRVNPYDVENAAWHFLCVAKNSGIEDAVKRLLPAPNDPRPPMKEVLEMFRTGDRERVLRRIEQFPPETPTRRRAEFYGYLYLAMHADAAGETALALQWLKKSIAAAGVDYMGDVTRTYAEHLEAAADKKNEAADPAPGSSR